MGPVGVKILDIRREGWIISNMRQSNSSPQKQLRTHPRSAATAIPLQKIAIIAIVALAPLAGGPGYQAEAASDGGSYYDGMELPIFNPYPVDTGRSANRAWRVRYFGPVGIGIDLKRPGMTMEIVNVEEGSPAAATGKLKKGQIIESINGVVLKGKDPRIILGDIITEAEAKDGKINLKIKGEGDVLVQIPVMGAYSTTWPENCAKSDKIVRNLADLLAKEEKPSWGSVLFLLSTGEEKDLEVVRKWMKNRDSVGGITWEIGYTGIGVCEYYLRTGDQSVLPAIKKATEDLKERMYNGGWSGRGAPAAFTYSTGSGQVHASGMYAMVFVLMAKLCGVEVDEYLFNESFKQFYRFAGHGNVAYGDGPPEGGFRDNGKTSGLALAMAVAAQLSPEGENSVYAKARDNSAMKAFYATNWFHAAHTGGGMGEIWHHGAMALMREKRPIPYRSYLDTRRWVMDSSRRHDGSIAIEGMDDRYNRSVTDASGQRAWGTYFALTYTYPRKHLQIWGAPRSKWAKTFPLPARPWGNAADDIFQSPEPVEYPGKVKLTMEDLLNEKVETDASLAVIAKLNDPETSEDEVFKYLLHPEYGLRVAATRKVVERGWDHLVVPLLKAEDPRLREAALLTMAGMFKGRAFPNDQLTPEMFDLVGKIVDDPNEAWWVTIQAVKALGRADADRIAKHRDRLMELLEYDSVWLQTDAVLTLTRIATEPDHYKVVLPAIIDKAASFRNDAASWQTTSTIAKAMSGASPEVKKFADPLIKKSYASVPVEITDPGTGALMNRAGKTIRTRVGSILKSLPGGEEYVRRLPKTTLASYISGKDSDQYIYDGKFKPNKKLIGTWVWAVWPPPNNPGEIDTVINKWLKPQLDKLPIKVAKPKDTIELGEDGKVAKSGFFRNYFWSGDMLIGADDGQALKMEIRTYEGVDFLLIEKGGFNPGPDDDGTAEIPKDFHCGYHVYIRKQ